VLMPSVTSVLPEQNTSSVWMPIAVHAPWVRLRLWSTSALAAGFWDGSPPTNQLLVYAHVAGHSEETYLEVNEDTPYGYDAMVTP